MSKEETIKNLQKLKSFHNGSYGTAIAEAIKALEQQLCEDCISREEVRKLICQNNDAYGYSDRFHEFTEQCFQLPSVTPQPKVVKQTETHKDTICNMVSELPYDYDVEDIAKTVDELVGVVNKLLEQQSKGEKHDK